MGVLAHRENAAGCLEFIPSPPWGRGWTATGAFTSRGETGLRPPKGHPQAPINLGFGPQAGEGVKTVNPTNNNRYDPTKPYRPRAPRPRNRWNRKKQHRVYWGSSDEPSPTPRATALNRGRCPGWDLLNRRAPADENAGCGPPYPPRGRGLGMHNGHSSADAANRFTNVETRWVGLALPASHAGNLSEEEGKPSPYREGRWERRLSAS